MPNTKSAERRVRNSERKRLHNRSVTSRLKSLERKFNDALTAKNKDEANQALTVVTSALDKAVKSGVIHRRTADRKKSRLALRLNKVG
jgi:small subunit ribosomal protein S20